MSMSTPPDSGRAPTSLAESALDLYVEALASGDRAEAERIAMDLVQQGVPGQDVVRWLLAPALVGVGHGWRLGEWSIAGEHRATAITEATLLAVSDAALALPGAVGSGSTGRVVVACSEGEWHTLPGLMVAEVLRMRGADVTFVGPSVPADDLHEFLGDDRPSVVAVTCSTLLSLAGAWRTVTAARAVGLTVVCGGGGFRDDGRWAWAIGADQWAPDVIHGANLVMAALDGPPRPPRGPVGDPDVATEVQRLRREHGDLLQNALAMAERQDTRVHEGEAAHELASFDLDSALRAVTSATAVADPAVVTDYVTWYENDHRVRALPVDFIATAFDCVLAVLPAELPVARAMALTARGACGR